MCMQSCNPRASEDALSWKAVPVTPDVSGGVTLWWGLPGHCRVLSSSPASTQTQSVTHPCLCSLGPGSASLTTTALVFGLKPFSVWKLGRQWGIPRELPFSVEEETGG